MKAISIAGLIIPVLFIGLLSNTSATPYDGAGPGQSTIGVGGDYGSLFDACEAISAAPLTGGDWDFLILNDLEEPRNSSLIQSEPSSHTITLRPAPGVDATVTFMTTQTQTLAGHLTIGAKWVYQVSGAYTRFFPTHNVTIDGCNTPNGSTRNLRFKNVTGPGARALIAVHGDCDDIRVKNCNLDSYGVDGYSSSEPLPVAGVAFVHLSLGLGMDAPPAKVQNNGLVQNCGFSQSGNFSAVAVSLNYQDSWSDFPNVPSGNFIVKDNDITSLTMGIRTFGVRQLQIADNTIRLWGDGTKAVGISSQPAADDSHMEISGNAITFSNTIQTTRVEGISTRELGSACKTTIENNMISGDFSREGIYVGSPCAYGIRSEAEAGSTVTLRHNSISIRGTNTTVPSAGFRLGAIPNQSFDSYGKVILRNNIIRAGMENCTAVETQGTSATIDSDFNALFAIPGANIGRCSQPPFGPAPPETLTWWQYVSGQDSHSVNIDPYVAAGEDSGVWVGPPDSDQADLHFTSYPGPDYLAPALTGVSIDIDREPRTGEQAVIGADTITIPPTRVEEWRLYQ